MTRKKSNIAATITSDRKLLDTEGVLISRSLELDLGRRSPRYANVSPETDRHGQL